MDLICVQTFTVVWNISRPLPQMLSKWIMHKLSQSGITHPTITHPSYNWFSWGLGAMFLKLSVREWMLQWCVFWWCA
jgi:hypothetical protein